MAEEKKQPNKEEIKDKQPNKEKVKTEKTAEKEAPQAKKRSFGDRRGFKGPRRDRRNNEKSDDFEQRILDIARVTRVMAGGKRMRFRACVAVGDKKGKIGVGVAKGADVTLAVNKAVNKAKKELVDVPLIKDTIPHEIYNKFSAAKILFKPAKTGRGVIAGGVVRVILELAGVKNITSKILGTNNKLSNAKCTVDALRRLKRVEGSKKTDDKTAKSDKKNVKKEDKKESSSDKKEKKNKK